MGWQGDWEHDARKLGGFDAHPAESLRRYAFTRYLAAARGDLPFETYDADMRRLVHAEIDADVWARRARRSITPLDR